MASAITAVRVGERAGVISSFVLSPSSTPDISASIPFYRLEVDFGAIISSAIQRQFR